MLSAAVKHVLGLRCLEPDVCTTHVLNREAILFQSYAEVGGTPNYTVVDFHFGNYHW